MGTVTFTAFGKTKKKALQSLESCLSHHKQQPVQGNDSIDYAGDEWVDGPWIDTHGKQLRYKKLVEASVTREQP